MSVRRGKLNTWMPKPAFVRPKPKIWEKIVADSDLSCLKLSRLGPRPASCGFGAAHIDVVISKLKVLWICGLPRQVQNDVLGGKDHGAHADWSWVMGHLPPPDNVELHIACRVARGA